MTRYPDLDPIAAMLEAITTRTDPDSPEWMVDAREIWVALNPIVDKRDAMEAWLPDAWTYLGDHPDDPDYQERLDKWTLVSMKHSAYGTFLESAHATLTASPKSHPCPLTDDGTSTMTPSAPVTTPPVSGPNTVTTGTHEHVGSLTMLVRGIPRFSLTGAPSDSP